jgi:hypothetical protein
VATVRTDGKEPRLVAYVVLADEAADPVVVRPALRDALRRALPEYMVPSAIVPLRTLPLTPNGKVNRRALPAPADDPSDVPPFVAPRTEMERTVVEVWREVLGRERIGVDDGFFALGGNSLDATRVAVWLGQQLGANVPVRALFEATTPAALAAWLDAHTGGETADDLAEILAELDAMTEEQARALLAHDRGEVS